MIDKKSKPLIVILGPTAVGKTSVSIALAKTLYGEIISADSRLLYRGLDIGTAKPTHAERQDVPHHMIDVSDPDKIWSLAVYQREAYRMIDDVLERGKLPFLVGGTGQYIRSIIEGWRIPPQKPDRRLRGALERWTEEIGVEQLHAKLKKIDPEAANKIDYRNVRRTIRALEVILKTGERFSEQRRKQACPYDAVIIGIHRPREALYERVDQRTDRMLDEGLIDEVTCLLTAGYDPGLPTFSAIGYREIIQYLQGEISREEAIALIKRNTRIFVRRQANWFKQDDPRIKWFLASENTLDKIITHIRRKLGESHQ